MGLILFAFDETDQDKDSGDPKTNVAKLWDAYIGAKVYIPGVGTRWRDSVKVGGSAWGHGVSRRVNSNTALLDEYLAKQSRLPGGGDKSKNRTLNNDDRFLQRQRDARVDVFLDSFDKLRGPYRW